MISTKTVPEADRTHCPRGHAYTEANTMHYQGSRYCRRCKNAYSNISKAKNRGVRGEKLERYIVRVWERADRLAEFSWVGPVSRGAAIR